MRKRVLIAITQSNLGGAQRYVLDLALGLSRAFDVSVACGMPAGREATLAARLEQAGIRVVPLHSLLREVRWSSDLRSLRELYSLFRRDRPDIVHLNSSKMGLLGAVAARLARVPRIVFTAHGWEFNAPRPRWQRAFFRIASIAIVLLAHRTIAVSQAVRRSLGLRLAQRRMRVVYNALPTRIPESRERARAALAEKAGISLDPGAPWIGTVAELHPVKGLPIAIEAMQAVAARVPGVQYFIVGEGSMREALASQIHRLGLGGSVRLLGYVDDAARLLPAFDLFVLPSRSEALPYALLEAGAAGLPCVASRVGGIPEIVLDEESGLLVAPGDPDLLADAVTRLLRTPEFAGKLGEALRTSVQERFSRDSMLARTASVYLE